MSLRDALAAQPIWVFYWVKMLGLCAFLLPVTLLFWKQSQLAGILTLAASFGGHAGLQWLYNRLGYVKLLGLPHLVLWGPLAVCLFLQIRRPDMPAEPAFIMWLVLTVILISLVFDLLDVLRYIAGNRVPARERSSEDVT